MELAARECPLFDALQPPEAALQWLLTIPGIDPLAAAQRVDTCRRRHLLPWPYLAKVIAERRKGNPAPPLPVAA
jgi:hypothetical protein